jgi:anti-sigma regulatory factor (Ser/Thr protein kinase)
MASRLGGWSGIAREYPLFSRTWFAYRMRSFLAPLGLLALVLVFFAAFARPREGLPYLIPALCKIWLVVALALFLGRALAVLVCRQGWTPPREAAGVACALAFGVLVSLSLTPFTRVGPEKPNRAMTEREAALARESMLVNGAVWLLALSWLGGSGDLVAYFRQRRMLREVELLGQVARYKDERNEVEMRLAVLASQVEPHFLFNTLSGVRAAMLSDPARGVVMIDHLVDYLRSTIPQLRADRDRTFVTLGSQLDAAQAYLGIIQARLPRLAFRIECPAGLRDAAIPPLMLISLVENAIKHGIELKRGPGLIRVSAVRSKTAQEDVLALSVADDGIGFGTAASGSGIGLSNIRERLQHLYGGAATLSLREADGGGVVASIMLPIRLMAEGAA